MHSVCRVHACRDVCTRAERPPVHSVCRVHGYRSLCAGVDCTLPRISSSLKRVTEQHALNLTKLKGTLVDLAVMGQVLSDERDVEEWQVVLSKKDDDPFGLDRIELRIAPRAGADTEGLRRRLTARLIEACEVSPNALHLHTLDEMLAFLGMESQMKEQRFLDRRPKE